MEIGEKIRELRKRRGISPEKLGMICDLSGQYIRKLELGVNKSITLKTARKALFKYLLSRRDQLPCLWVTEERRVMTKEGIKTAVERLCKRAVITDARPGAHTFRHTAAINYLRNGGGEFTLQMMLGHSTLQMTRRYVSSLSAEDMFRVHEQASPVDNMRLR